MRPTGSERRPTGKSKGRAGRRESDVCRLAASSPWKEIWLVRSCRLRIGLLGNGERMSRSRKGKPMAERKEREWKWEWGQEREQFGRLLVGESEPLVRIWIGPCELAAWRAGRAAKEPPRSRRGAARGGGGRGRLRCGWPRPAHGTCCALVGRPARRRAREWAARQTVCSWSAPVRLRARTCRTPAWLAGQSALGINK